MGASQELVSGPTGLALLCSPEGLIREVLLDTLPFDQRPVPGLALEALFDVGSKGKAGFLLQEIQSAGAAFGWELNASLAGSLKTLHVGGGTTSGRVLILASVSAGQMNELVEQLMAINNEQANAIRMVMKDHLSVLGEGAAKDAALYDEITRLNTELANQQRELAKKNMQLQNLVQQRDELLGMAAHDLRNPLGAVLNFSQFLIDELGTSISEEHREFLATIQTQTQFMLDMVNELLDISKIEAGKLELHPLRLDPAAFVEHNLAMNRPLARKKHIELEFERDGDPPEIDLDPGRMDQVLNNLLTNAVKYSHTGSTVVVRVAPGEDLGVLVSVRDRGVGIPEDKLDRLFRPFGRVAAEGTAGELSTGLGLAIARKIVEAHGGRIRVESEVGVGSTFSVWLPSSLPV